MLNCPKVHSNVFPEELRQWTFLLYIWTSRNGHDLSATTKDPNKDGTLFNISQENLLPVNSYVSLKSLILNL